MRRAALVASVAVLVAAAILAAGCAAVRLRGAHLLAAPEDGGLLIVDCTLTPSYDVGAREERIGRLLETGMLKLPGNEALDEVSIERADAPGHYIYGTRFADVVVFPRLVPGSYALHSMGHRRFIVDHLMQNTFDPGESPRGGAADVYFDRREFPFDGVHAEMITFRIGPRSLGYVGGIDIEAQYDAIENEERGVIEFTGQSRLWRAEVAYDPVRERNAWAKILRLAEGTAWADSIISRIDAINSGRWVDPADPPGEP